MGWRLASFVFCQAAGGLLGWMIVAAWPSSDELVYQSLSSLWGCLAGLVLASIGWLVLDTWRGLVLIRWIRKANPALTPPTGGIWQEIGERANRQFRERDSRLQSGEIRLHDFLAAFQVSPNGVVLLDARGRIEWFNQMAAAHFGFEPHQDLLQYFSNLVRDPVFAAYHAGRDFQSGVVMSGRNSRQERPVRLSVHLYPYGEDRLLLLSRDVTALEQADAMRRDFVANVSHEIRTPLTVVAGFVETLQNLPLDDQQRRRYLDLMAQQTERMQVLVSDLLTLSSLENGEPVSSVVWVDAGELLSRSVDEARALSRSLNRTAQPAQTVMLEQGEATEIAGSFRELMSAVSNLLGNAVRYSPPGAIIKLQWQVLPDGRCEISVQDDGPGIEAHHIPRLTERFYRVDSGRSRETGGTGLGLAIVKHVVQRHGSELRIDSVPGAGSTFRIVLPRSRVRPASQQPDDEATD
jgi:two-component system, OmpR family, phosphate regulon sensor histidine kinase PhoR